MNENRVKQQLSKFKAEQKAKSRKRNLLKNYIKVNPNKYEDKLNAMKITQQADKDLFANALKTLMRRNKK